MHCTSIHITKYTLITRHGATHLINWCLDNSVELKFPARDATPSFVMQRLVL